MVEKTLNPTNQADWKKFGKQFETDFDAFENEVKIPNHEKRKKNDEVARLNTLSKEEGRVRGFLDDFVGKALRGSGYKENTILTTTRKIRTIVIGRLKDEGQAISEENVLRGLQDFVTVESTKKAGKKYEAILKVLNENKQSEPVKKPSSKDNSKEATGPTPVSGEKKKTVVRKKSAKTEEEKKPDVVLTDAEKVDAVKFFEKEILPLYQAKREENRWTGCNDDVREFLKEQFVQTANTFNFLDGDDPKINLAWDLVGADLQSKIESIEAEIAKAEIEKKTSQKDFTLDEVYQKLKSAGADDEDVKYFFNLHKKDRQDFLLSSDEDLKLRIEKLREAREIDEERVTEDKKEEIERKLRDYGNYMKGMRTTYLQKEYEFNKTSSAMKRFFRMDRVDMGNAEKELENSKKDYLEAVENYLNVMVTLEKPSDKEEREIIYRYAHFGEALQLMNAKEDMKLEKNPKLENFKRSLGAGTANFLDKYKELLGKPKELIAKKTGSKVLGFSGGIAAVGGAMALAANYIPGLRNITLPLGIAVATKCFYEKAENKAVIEKEKSLEKGVELLEKRLAYIDDLGAEVDEAFKKELGLAVENITEEVAKEKEAVGKRMALSLVKAIVVSTLFYGAGQAIGGFFRHDDLSGADLASEKPEHSVQSAQEVSAEKSTAETNQQSAHPHGGNIHQQNSFPPTKEVSGVYPQVSDPIIENQAKILSTIDELKNPAGEDVLKAEAEKSIQERLMEMKKPIASDIQTQTEAAPNELGGDDSMKLESDSSGATETPVGNTEFEGIILDESGKGKIVADNGLGIKDMVAKLLIDNHEKLTEGKMGWDPNSNKYASVQEWADKRAIGIVGEFTKGSHEFDQISAGSEIKLDMKNLADIKIVDFIDGQEVESSTNSDDAFGSENQEDIFESNEAEPADQGDIFENNEAEPAEVTQGNKVMSSEVKESAVSVKENITGNITEKDILPEDAVEKDMEEVRKNMGKQETLAAKRIGIDPEHYAKINQMSTAEFIAEAKRVDNIVHGGGEDSIGVTSSNLPVGSAFSDDEAVNIRMGRVLDYLMRDGKIENPNQSIAETLRTVSQQDLMGSIRTYEGIFGSIDDNESIAMRLNEDEVYSEYMASLIQAELKDMLGSNTDEGKVMRELATLRGVAMRDLADNELLSAFKEATKDVVGNVEYRDNDTVGKYIVRIIRAAHDEGVISKLRDSLAKIEVAA